MAKNKTPNFGAGDPSLTILIDKDCPSHDWSSTTWVAHQGRRSWGWEVPTPKIYRKGQSMFWPIKMSHSFIQNCCSYKLQVSQYQRWTIWHNHFTDLAYADDATIHVWSAPSRHCPPINVFAAILGFKLSWPKTKVQNMGVDVVINTLQLYPVNNPHRWCTSWRSREEFIYLGSKQSSNGYWRPDVLHRIGLAC